MKCYLVRNMRGCHLGVYISKDIADKTVLLAGEGAYVVPVPFNTDILGMVNSGMAQYEIRIDELYKDLKISVHKLDEVCYVFEPFVRRNTYPFLVTLMAFSNEDAASRALKLFFNEENND